MSVSSTKSTIAYVGDGVTTAFAFPYPFFNSSHLMVTTLTGAGVQALKSLGGDYTVSGTQDTDYSAYMGGGNVNFLVAPAAGVIILIQRRTPKVSIATFINFDNLRATDLNHTLDYLTLQSQEGPGGDSFKGYIAQAPSWGTWSKGDWFILAPPTQGEVWALIATADGTGSLAAWRGFGGISLA